MTTQNELCSRIRSIITDNRYLTLGACLDDEVWVAPLAYYVEPDYSFVYYSSKESKHSKFIEKNNVVSCSIFNSSLPSDDVDGMQFVGEVSQVPSNELVEVVPKYFLQSFPLEKIRAAWQQPISNFKGLAIKRFYRIKPTRIFTIDLDTTEVDRRVEVDLSLLKSTPMMKD